MIGVTHDGAAGKNFGKRVLTQLEVHTHQVVTIKVEQIESVIEDRNFRATRFHPSTVVANARALLHQAEGGPAFRVEGHDFAVQDRGAGTNMAGNFTEFGILTGHLVLVPRDQAHMIALNKCEGAITVPLDLEQPVGIVEGLVYKRCQHGVNGARHGGLACPGQISDGFSG